MSILRCVLAALRAQAQGCPDDCGAAGHARFRSEGRNAMSARIQIVPVETDVLVIGGGLAGCMAAIKAAEKSVKVIIADKANTEASGCAGTGIDHSWAYVPPVHGPLGYTFEDLIQDHMQGPSGGFVRKDLLNLVAGNNYARMLDIEKFGIKMRYADSALPGGWRLVPQFHSVPTSINFDGRYIKLRLTREARKRGVEIYNRVMITDLLSSGGEIAGAVGVGVRDGNLYLFRAKAVVLSTGRSNRMTRSASGPRHNLRVPAENTGDGKAMALRAGVGVINMELLTGLWFNIGGNEINLGSPRNTTYPAGSITGSRGEVFVPRTRFFDWSVLGREKIEAAEVRRRWLESRANTHRDYFALRKQGKGPFFLDLTGGTEEEIRYIEWSISHEAKGCWWLKYLSDQEGFDFRKDKLEYLPNTRELSIAQAGGVVVDDDLETDVKGLYAAGDEVGGLPFSSSPGAFSMGWHAGDMAAQRAGKQNFLADMASEPLEALKQLCASMLDRKTGYHWTQLELAVQDVVDYYCGDERSESYLERGLQRLDQLRRETPLKAENAHELGRCLEVRSIIENAEMVLRASMERKESRSQPSRFFRSDYPEQDDRNYFCFLSQKLVDGEVRFSKIPL
jgi:succinate dehydrogenase/fumarate reductase flavoprotein subunit